MKPKKLGTLTFVLDERLSRQKTGILARVINAMRQFAEVHVVSGGVTEEELLKRLEATQPSLVLAPWYRYLAWTRVEGFYGLTRNSGPTFAGYYCEQLLPYELGDQADHLRAMLMDFSNLNVSEILILIRALMQDTRRCGILPLLEANTPVYCENWYSNQGMGQRMDAVLALPGIANSEWTGRANAVRICVTALWSLIYERGPGKSELQQAITTNQPKAYFQVAADRYCLLMRLCYSMPAWSPKNVLREFWPDPMAPTSPAQLLLKYADFTRVHRVSENADIEIVVGFLKTAPAERAPEQVHTLWVEPVTAKLMMGEVPFESPNPNSPHLRALPGVPSGPAPRASTSSAPDKAQERFVVEAAVKIRELKRAVMERDELINDLRMGGVGTAAPLPPPDMDSLLEAFQARFFEARFEIRQIELQIAQLEEVSAPHIKTETEIESLRRKIARLTALEHGWLRKIASILEAYREEKRRGSNRA